MKKLFLSLFLLFLVVLSAKEISIKSEDGFVLKGWIDFPKVKKDKYPLALIAHQFGSNHTKWIEFAAHLRKRGFATLNVDLRGHGQSIMQNGNKNQIVKFKNLSELRSSIKKSAKKVNFKNITSDLSAWMDFVGTHYKDIDIDKLAFFGASLGGGALIGIMFDYEPKFAVLFSPGNTKEVGAEDSIADMAFPIMFVSSNKDFALSRTIKYTKEAVIPTTLILPGSGHGEALLKASKKYVDIFLDETLMFQ